jgi:hypothetical protein
MAGIIALILGLGLFFSGFSLLGSYSLLVAVFGFALVFLGVGILLTVIAIFRGLPFESR